MKNSKMMKLTLILCLGFSLTIHQSVSACSAFGLCKGNQIIVGKNLDWICNLGFLVVNKRNITKKTFLSSGSSVLEWTSKYGSITFTQNGVGFTSGGMNEAGLVIEESWLGQTKYPPPDERPVIDEIQWIQYQLDNCSTVEEVIKTNPKLRIQKYFGESHYFVYDKSGNAAAIDFLNGEMVYHILRKTNVQVLTNDTYKYSSDSLNIFEGFGGSRIIPGGANSLFRFARAAKMVKDYETNKSANIIDYGFSILSEVSQRSTAWSVVYDISNLRIFYKTSSSPEIKEVSFKEFDFDCISSMLLIDLNIQRKGNISNLFEQYTLDKNREMITKVIKNWRENNFALNITDAEVERLIQYPETFSHTVTDIDGNVYHTVKIGTQTWMVEDLKTTRYRNGDSIGTTIPATLDISSEKEPKYQWAYNGDENNAAVYGRLYTWYAVTDNRNICPEGWHVPTYDDWMKLINYLGGKNMAFYKLKESGTAHWKTSDSNVTNESGFTGLPGGSHWTTIFKDIGIYGHYWSTAERDEDNAWRLLLDKNFNEYSFLNSSGKKTGWSVRCIKD